MNSSTESPAVESIKEAASLPELMLSRRFAPLLAGISLTAFSDNLYRSALMILIEFVLIKQQDLPFGSALVVLAPGIFVLPYFIFSSPAGQMADKLDKALMMKRLKFIEIFLMAFATLALILENVPLLLVTLFLTGVQSAFYSPLKYAILPQLLNMKEILAGNALAGAGLFLSILLGTIAGASLVMLESGPLIVGLGLIATAIIGWISSLYLLPAPSNAPDIKLTRNPLKENIVIFKQAISQPTIGLIISGRCWFWFLSALYVAQMPSMVSNVMKAEPPVFTLFFSLFSIGIAGGALLARFFLGEKTDGRLTALGTLGMAVFGTALAITLQAFSPPDSYALQAAAASAAATTAGAPSGESMLMPLSVFLEHPLAYLIMGELIALALFAGLYIVPLEALLQIRSKDELRARTIAAGNIAESAAIILASLTGATLLAIGFSIPTIWLLVGLLGFLALPIIAALVPHLVLKRISAKLLRAAFDVKVEGLENLDKAGDRAVIVANHVSLLDGPLLATFLPNRPIFAVNTEIAERWWAKPFLALIEAAKVDPTRPMAFKALIKRVQEGGHCVIFPEGRITTTGGLMKINEGPGLVAEKADACIVPIRISGAEYTVLSYLKGLTRRHLFPSIRLTILPPVKFTTPKEVSGRKRRQLAAQQLYDLMSNLIFETSPIDQTLVEALLEARDIHGGNHYILEDRERKAISYNRLLAGMTILGKKLAAHTNRNERVGLMLPNANGFVLSFFGLLYKGRIPALLNYSAGAANIRSACTTATLNTIITSREFIEVAKLDSLARTLSEGTDGGKKLNLIYLEDIKDTITWKDRLTGLALRPLLRQMYCRSKHKANANDAAVVLFTSGSEGTPKGVVLSHRNLLANRWQAAARLDFSQKDIALNALPLFHAFGLTAGLLIPLLAGARTVLYPSPLHYRIVPLMAYDSNATILFGTDTFLRGYARTAHPYDFYSVRFICAGAEKVKTETHRTYADKFGVRILEGYGATETAPVIALNTPMHCKQGTVGRLLPGIEAKLSTIPGIEEGGRLSVTGPNVMLGYLKAEKPGVLQPPEETPTPDDVPQNWYDTGDIVAMDEEGFLTICGRAKRFAKVAGEMISLPAVEDLAQRCWPDHQNAAISEPDPRKGEKIILVSTNKEAKIEQLRACAKEGGQTELMVPSGVQYIEELPQLSTGKTDYVKLKELLDAGKEANKDAEKGNMEKKDKA